MKKFFNDTFSAPDSHSLAKILVIEFVTSSTSPAAVRVDTNARVGATFDKPVISGAF